MLLIVTVKALCIIRKCEDCFNKAIEEMSETMGEKERVMRWLDAGTTNLSLLINVGNSVAAVGTSLVLSNNIVTSAVAQTESEACVRHHSRDIPGELPFVVPRTAAHQDCLQRVSNVPRTFNDLKETVLDCQRHFDGALKKARMIFSSIDVGNALDRWMKLVVESTIEIRDFYAKSSLGENAF